MILRLWATMRARSTEAGDDRTFGERAADCIAKWGGSWPFVLTFLGVLVLWTAINGHAAARWLWGAAPFDPYPYILLNLVLSCLAAIQAPIIMMSNRRQDAINQKRQVRDLEVDEITNRVALRLEADDGVIMEQLADLQKTVAELGAVMERIVAR